MHSSKVYAIKLANMDILGQEKHLINKVSLSSWLILGKMCGTGPAKVSVIMMCPHKWTRHQVRTAALLLVNHVN